MKLSFDDKYLWKLTVLRLSLRDEASLHYYPGTSYLANMSLPPTGQKPFT